MAVFDFDYEKTFNNAKTIFSQIHFRNGKEKEALTRLKSASSLGFEVACYAFILHDADIEENGEVKTPHIHLMFTAKEGHSKQYWLDALFKAFGDLCVTREAITLSSVQYERGALRYLTHIDKPYKTQYSPEKVTSFPPSWFDDAMKEQPLKNPPLVRLMECQSKSDIYDLVGLSSYDKARKIWEEIRTEQFKRDNYDALLEAYNDVADDLRSVMVLVQKLRQCSFAPKTNWPQVCALLDSIESMYDRLEAKWRKMNDE